MNYEIFEPLSAFVDGERVQPFEVAKALETPGVGEFLVDCARLRWDLGETESPGATWVQETRRRLSSQAPLWLAAAGIAATLLFSALWIGRPLASPETEVLPEPDRVIQLERGRDWSG